MNQGLFVGILSQNLSVYSGQWGVVHMHKNTHFWLFREQYTVLTCSSSLLFLFVNIAQESHGCSLCPQMKQKNVLFNKDFSNTMQIERMDKTICHNVYYSV